MSYSMRVQCEQFSWHSSMVKVTAGGEGHRYIICVHQAFSEYQKVIFLFLNQNIRCEYSKEPSQWDGSFEHPKHMQKNDG